MPRGDYRLFVTCTEPECRESTTFGYTLKADYREGYQRHHGKWKCVRHSSPGTVLAPGNEVLTAVLTAVRPVFTDCNGNETPLSKMSWRADGAGSSSGYVRGPGFQAFAGDWPEGTRLEVTARILPPEGGDGDGL